MIRLFALFLMLVPLAAPAQGLPPLLDVGGNGLPALFDVAGVAADDTLNVRSGPGTDSPVIGELAPDRQGVEIVSTDASGNWGLMNLEERAGWVSLAYMARQAGDWFASASTVAGCFGTEPFWGLTVSPGSWSFDIFGEPRFVAEPSPFTGPGAAGFDRAASAELSGDDGFAALVISPGICSDGMSDQLYGLEARLITTLSGMGTQLWSGCCTVTSR
ncbi:SH3 domain-containing protein [Roseisalinus antarcticus]|uniref:Bacterial SH3 domain protein n=1 Tax=Roseisalinus antarcticus TaxID=254357 RepID=A0A1Y5S6C7_9RHOB|nr:SH3 domain-containing protein [Roseisalinus antarcticus]SLN32982.1 Bacterial SH3 domain protein [Roseisalinus antarcticus]